MYRRQCPFGKQHRALTVQIEQKSLEAPQSQYLGQVLDVLVVTQQPQLHFIDICRCPRWYGRGEFPHDPESQVVDVDRIADGASCLRRQMPTIPTVQKAMAAVPADVLMCNHSH